MKRTFVVMLTVCVSVSIAGESPTFGYRSPRYAREIADLTSTVADQTASTELRLTALSRLATIAEFSPSDSGVADPHSRQWRVLRSVLLNVIRNDQSDVVIIAGTRTFTAARPIREHQENRNESTQVTLIMLRRVSRANQSALQAANEIAGRQMWDGTSIYASMVRVHGIRPAVQAIRTPSPMRGLQTLRHHFLDDDEFTRVERDSIRRELYRQYNSGAALNQLRTEIEAFRNRRIVIQRGISGTAQVIERIFEPAILLSLLCAECDSYAELRSFCTTYVLSLLGNATGSVFRHRESSNLGMVERRLRQLSARE